MEQKDWLVGTLLLQGYLRTQTGKILLTTNTKEMPQWPETGSLPVAEEDVGKIAVARGELVGEVLYSAQVMEKHDLLMGALIKELGRAKTLILCTHILSEVEAACDRVLIIHRGKIVADGTPDSLRAAARGQDRLHVQIKGPADSVREGLQGLTGAARVSEEDGAGGDTAGQAGCFVVELAGGYDLREAVFTMARDRGWILLEMRRESVRLEDVFRQLTTEGAS